MLDVILTARYLKQGEREMNQQLQHIRARLTEVQEQMEELKTAVEAGDSVEAGDLMDKMGEEIEACIALLTRMINPPSSPDS